jgi:hypothetical protein
MDTVVVVEILVAVAIGIFTLGHVLLFHAVFVGPAHEGGGAAAAEHHLPMQPAATAS